MDESRERSIAPSAQPLSPESFTPGTVPVSQGDTQPSAPPFPTKPSSVDVTGRLIRLLAHRGVYLGAGFWRLLRPNLGWVALSVVLLAIIGVQSLMLILPRLVRNSPSADVRVAMLEPAPSVLDFLRGQQNYDAELMWSSFSPGLQEALEDQGVAKDDLATQAESERRAGHRYRDFEYVGGVDLENNQRRFFYVVDIQSPTPERNGTFSFIFTVDRAGKIVSVDM